MKLRQPDKIRSHGAVLVFVFIVILLVGGIWAFQLTQFFQRRLGEAPDALTESQQRWEGALGESEKIADDLPVAQGSLEDITEEMRRILKGEVYRQETLDQIAQDLLTEIDHAQAEEQDYAEEE